MLPASEIQISALRPKKGAMQLAAPINSTAPTGLLYLLLRRAKNGGSIPDSAMAKMAREPPTKKAFQLVTMPEIPPMMRILAASSESPKAFCMAVAVTRLAERISLSVITKETEKITITCQRTARMMDSRITRPILRKGMLISSAAWGITSKPI